MGLMQFVVSPPDRITEDLLRLAYMSGVDRVAWRVELSVQRGQLVVRRAVSESGSLHVPWPVEGHGLVTLSTASLMERPEPYLLPLELARGTLGQLSNQLAQWQATGVIVAETATRTVAEAMACFGQAAVGQGDSEDSADWAEQAIRLALDAGDLLADCFVHHWLAAGRPPGGRPPLLLGANLGEWLPDQSSAEEFLRCFNAALVPICWRDIEPAQGNRRWEVCDRQIQWCRAQGLSVCCGPLLRLDPRGIPDWLYLYEDDFDSILACVAEFAREAVARYRGRVEFWQCTSRMIAGEAISLSEEEKLRLAASTIATARSLDRKTPALLAFDQPWGEYLSYRNVDLPALYVADALVRAGLELSGVLLEINLGYHADCSLPRSLLEFSRQLDHWGLLGLPLMISITVPSADHHDPLARPRPAHPPAGWTPQTQQSWVARYLPLILSKPLVHGVFWNQLHDSQPHDFPHAGLLDADGRPKPALDSLAAIRQRHAKWTQ